MNVLRRTVTTLGALATAAALSLLGATAAHADPATAVSITPASIDSFTFQATNPQWEAPTRDRLGRTVFTLSPDGTFQVTQPDGYPTLTGTFGDDGTFQASDSSSAGATGGTGTAVPGQIGRAHA